MKKILSLTMLMALLLAGACQKNEVSVLPSGEEMEVTLTVAVPGTLATKAVETELVSAGAETDIVYYEIWDADKTKKLYPVLLDKLHLALGTFNERAVGEQGDKPGSSIGNYVAYVRGVLKQFLCTANLIDKLP
jgi:hypothetical protein